VSTASEVPPGGFLFITALYCQAQKAATLFTPIYSSTPVTARADKEAASTTNTSPSLVPKPKGVPGVDGIAEMGITMGNAYIFETASDDV